VRGKGERLIEFVDRDVVIFFVFIFFVEGGLLLARLMAGFGT